MANLVEQATLLVKDSSTGQIKRINAALKDLMATAKAFKGVKANFNIDTKGLQKAIGILQQGKKDILATQKAAAAATKQQTRDAVMMQRAAVNAEKQQNKVLANRILTQKAARVNAAAMAKDTEKATARAAAISQKIPYFNSAQIAKARKAIADIQAPMTKISEREGGFFSPRQLARAQRGWRQIETSAQRISAESEKGFFSPRQIIRAQRGFQTIQENMASAARSAVQMGATVPRIRPPPGMPWGAPGFPPPRPPRPPAGGVPPAAGGGGGFVRGLGRVGRGVAGGLTGGGYGETIPYSIGRGLGRAAKEGISDADVAETMVRLKQLPQAQVDALNKAAAEIVAEQTKTPSGALLNQAQTLRFLAEALPVAKGDIEGAKSLTREMISMTKIGFAVGRPFETARSDAIQYSKAIDQMGVMFDRTGKFIPGQAEKWFGVFRQVLPDIGEEMTGPFARQAVKYAGVARYGMDPQALAALLFMGEEFGASSAGVKMREAVRSLEGIRITDAAAKNLSKLGLLSPEEAEAARKGRTGKRVADIIGGKAAEPELKQQNIFEWINRKLFPMYEADLLKRGKKMADMEPQVLQADMAKFAARLGFASNAADLVAAALIRAPELKLQVDQALARSGERAAAEQALGKSTRIGAAAMQTQLQGVLGQAFQAAEPILLPAMHAVSTSLGGIAATIKAAGEGDADAQNKLIKGAMIGALATPAIAALTTAVGAIAPSLGVTTGLAAAAGAETPASRSIALAGVSLNAAGASLQSAAKALAAAAVVQAGGWAKLLPIVGAAGIAATGLAIPAGLAGTELTHDQEALTEEQRKMLRESLEAYKKMSLTRELTESQARLKLLETPGVIPKPVDVSKIKGRDAAQQRAAAEQRNAVIRQMEAEREVLRARIPVLQQELDRIRSQEAATQGAQALESAVKEFPKAAPDIIQFHKSLSDVARTLPPTLPAPWPTPAAPGVTNWPGVAPGAPAMPGMPAGIDFSTVFQTGAEAITAAGTMAGTSIGDGGTAAASSIQGAAGAIAAAGVSAADAIRAAAQSIPTHFNISGGGVDTGSQTVTGNTPK